MLHGVVRVTCTRDKKKKKKKKIDEPLKLCGIVGRISFLLQNGYLDVALAKQDDAQPSKCTQ